MFFAYCASACLVPARGYSDELSDGLASLRIEQFDRAERQLNAAVARAERSGTEPIRLIDALVGRAELFRRAGRLQEAGVDARRAEDLARNASPPMLFGQAQALLAQGEIASTEVRAIEAQRLCAEAQRLAEAASHRPAHFEARVLYCTAQTFLAQDIWTGQLPRIERARALAEPFTAQFPTFNAELLVLHAHAVRKLSGDEMAVAELLERALEICTTQIGEQSGCEMNVLMVYGYSETRQGRATRSRQYAERMLPIAFANLPPGHVANLSMLSLLQDAYLGEGRYEEALAVGDEIEAHCRQIYGDGSFPLSAAIESRAVTLAQMGRAQEALPLFREVIRMRAILIGESTPAFGASLINYAIALESVGRVDEAEAIRASTERLFR